MAQKQYHYRLSNIEVTNKFVGYPTNGVPLPKIEDLQIHYVIDVKIDFENKLAFAITSITIHPPQDENMKLAQLEVVCSFMFLEFDEIFLKQEDNIFTMPVEIEILLKTSCYSTSRGILYCELKGTYLQGAFLPLENIGGRIMEDRKLRQEAVDKPQPLL